MSLNVASAIRSSFSPEKFTGYAPNNGLMESKKKDRFNVALGLSQKMKTYGIDLGDIKDLYNETDNSVRNRLKRNGLFLAHHFSDEVKNFKKAGSATIDLGPLYNNNEVAFELTEDQKVRTSFILSVDL